MVTAVLVYLNRAKIDQRLSLGLAMFAAYYVGALAYGLAIDPKPRMFLPAITAITAIGGMAIAAGWHTTVRWPMMVPLALLFAGGLLGTGRVRDMAAAERVADAWIGADVAATEINETSRRALPFSAAAGRVPDRVAMPRRHLSLAQGACPIRQGAMPLTRRLVVPPLGIARALDRWNMPAPPLTLCLFSRS